MREGRPQRWASQRQEDGQLTWDGPGVGGSGGLPLGSGSLTHLHALFSLCPGEDSSDLIRHFLIESSAKGVHLKGADEEPYFGEPAGPWVGPAILGWEGGGRGLLTQGRLFPRREPLCLCVPALHHAPGPALQTHHPAERWVWAPRRQHQGTGLLVLTRKAPSCSSLLTHGLLVSHLTAARAPQPVNISAS